MARAGWWRNKKRDRLLLRSAPFQVLCCPRIGVKLFGLQPNLRLLKQRAISAETVKTDSRQTAFFPVNMHLHQLPPGLTLTGFSVLSQFIANKPHLLYTLDFRRV